MEEKDDIKIEELFSYGMSKDGINKLLSDIKTAVKDGIKSIDCSKITFKNEAEKELLNESVDNACIAIDNNLKEIEELFERILSDWDIEKGGTNE